jgi:glycosyltransferase involved in cell wall biosynthesis
VPAGVRPPVRVVHHGVRLDRFRPTPRDGRARVPKLVAVGRLVEKKGYVDLLHALARVTSGGGSFSCDIYGDGPQHDELAALVQRHGMQGSVHLLGARSNDRVRAALDGADAFVLTPRVGAGGDRDGIPNVLVEAMACGLPVLTTDAGGITELVHDDVNGLVRPAGDVPAIAAGLDQLLRDPDQRDRLGAAARVAVEAGYDVDAAARELEELFRGTDRVEVPS